MSSELFGSQKGSEQIQRTDILKDDFGWEIPYESIPLPSAGIIYPPDSLLHNVKSLKIKAMTAREEDILASEALLKEGTAIDHLIKSCLTNKKIDVRELILGDRNALLIAIRITGYGAGYDIKTKCKFCNTYHEENVDLSALPIKRLKISPYKENTNLFEFELPVTKKKVLFKFLSAKKEKEKQQQLESLEKNNMGSFGGNVTTNLEYSIHSIEGITDRNKIKHFVLNMPAYDAKSLRNFIKENEPGMDMKFNYKCKNCGSLNNDISLPIGINFFWPV